MNAINTMSLICFITTLIAAFGLGFIAGYIAIAKLSGQIVDKFVKDLTSKDKAK